MGRDHFVAVMPKPFTDRATGRDPTAIAANGAGEVDSHRLGDYCSSAKATTKSRKHEKDLFVLLLFVGTKKNQIGLLRGFVFSWLHLF
jgi:hypothetical protein